MNLKSKISLWLKMTEAAKIEKANDKRPLSVEVINIDKAINLGMEWLCRAQDKSSSADGGVANFSLLSGWGASYPETTGYIVPTMIEFSLISGNDEYRMRAKKMLDWLVSIQYVDGGFQCGLIGYKPALPVTFNTGQILLGLAAGVKEFGDEYRPAMRLAADWLVKSQSTDGCWRQNPSPLTSPGEKSYETHVAWGLLEAARMDPEKRYGEVALANVHWAIKQQNENGWFRKCCVTDVEKPLTHTIGYVFRGLMEAYNFRNDPTIIAVCEKLASGCISATDKNGFIAGRLDENWKATVSSACLTGSVQIAHSLIMLYEITKNIQYREVAFAINKYVRSTIKSSGNPDIIGAVKGSFPVWGDYMAYQFPNWACKFFIDSHLAEKKIRLEENIFNSSQ
jgi:hypothetical protein